MNGLRRFRDIRSPQAAGSQPSDQLGLIEGLNWTIKPADGIRTEAVLSTGLTA
jgi:hypothetical protein